MNGSINVKWNSERKDYELTEESKTTMKQLPANVCMSVRKQLRHATQFTRDGLMDKVTEVSYGN